MGTAWKFLQRTDRFLVRGGLETHVCSDRAGRIGRGGREHFQIGGRKGACDSDRQCRAPGGTSCYRRSGAGEAYEAGKPAASRWRHRGDQGSGVTRRRNRHGGGRGASHNRDREPEWRGRRRVRMYGNGLGLRCGVRCVAFIHRVQGVIAAGQSVESDLSLSFGLARSWPCSMSRTTPVAGAPSSPKTVAE